MDLKFDKKHKYYSLAEDIAALLDQLKKPAHRHIDLDEEKIEYISKVIKEISKSNVITT